MDDNTKKRINKRGYVPSKEELVEYYITQNYSAKETAKIFNTSMTTLNRWLQKYQIFKPKEKKVEKCIIAWADRKIKFDFTPEECREYYINQNHTVQESAKYFNLTPSAFQRYLKDNNLTKDHYQTAETTKRVCMEKYGTVSHFTDETQEKIKQTCLARYGVENPAFSPEIRKKISEKLSTKPSYDYLYKLYIEENKSVKECASLLKVSKSAVQRWLNKVYNIHKPDSLRVKNIQKTCLEKYGVISFTQTEQGRLNRMQYCLEKYGVKNISQKDILHYDIWSDDEKMKKFLENAERKYTPYELKEYFNVSHSSILDKIHDLKYEYLVDINAGRSHYEDDLVQILKENGIDNIILNDRSILNGTEIDIYLPDYHLGIEFNGEYYHSELNPKYQDHNGRSVTHQKKSLLAESKGIFIFHIFEHEWDEKFINKNPNFKENKNNIINRILMLTKNNYRKVPARKCKIKEINYKEKKEFLEANHIQGNDVTSKIYLGLFYQDELISCMTFGGSKYKKYNYELTRFCTKIGFIVQGGASKLFKYFVNNFMKEKECVVSYNDITKTNGKIYSILGFINTSINSPNYWWVNLSTYDVRTRYQEQAGGEIERMHSQNYYRICDCGTKTWVYTKK